jgi:hypothetical protein
MPNQELIAEPKTKRCSKCGHEQPIDQFAHQSRERGVPVTRTAIPAKLAKLREQALAAGRVKASAEMVPPWVTSSMTPEDVMIQGLARGVSAQNMAGLLNHMGFKQHTTAFTDTQLVYQALQKLGGNASSTAVRDFLTSKVQDPVADGFHEVGPQRLQLLGGQSQCFQ